jgi:hypothetical protein
MSEATRENYFLGAVKETEIGTKASRKVLERVLLLAVLWARLPE